MNDIVTPITSRVSDDDDALKLSDVVMRPASVDLVADSTSSADLGFLTPTVWICLRRTLIYITPHYSPQRLSSPVPGFFS